MAQGTLFTEDFLGEGIRETAAWRDVSSSDLAAFEARLQAIFAAVAKPDGLNEAQTEERIIRPIIAALGWEGCFSVQERAEAKGRANVPDYLLFSTPDAFARADQAAEAAKRYPHAVAVADAKAWALGLDKRGAGAAEAETPSGQIIRYLSRADVQSDGKVRWAILTNGRHWRLYWQGAKARLEEYFEVDLGWLLALPGLEGDLAAVRPAGFADDAAWRGHWLKIMWLTFRRVAFLPENDGRTFHQLALDEGRDWESKVRSSLAQEVFAGVFPDLIRALVRADRERPATLDAAYLAVVREAALLFLYRLLFALYAEDRDLLPKRDLRYGGLSRLRDEVAERRDAGTTLSAKRRGFAQDCADLFRAIDEGDEAIGVPPYNGGLFSDRTPATALLDRALLADADFAPLLDRLARATKDGKLVRINFRDLSVQHLGSIYERLLEYEPVVDAGAPEGITVRLNASARKGSGSYYTPDELVALIIERTVGPLVEERIAAFEVRAAALASDTRRIELRLEELRGLDPAEKILELKIVDPAMGSGHFLVALVDYLAESVTTAMVDARAAVTFADYVSPLADRLKAIRAKIRAEADAHKWVVRDDHLDEKNLVKRLALKRVVHGVDKNPMAVELAKVALWLHSFTVGAPLSFLDHHLRCGDSILGLWVRPTVDMLHDRGALFQTNAITRVENVAGVMADIEQTTDNDIAAVTASRQKFGTVEEAVHPVADLFSLLLAETLMGVRESAPAKAPPLIEKMAGKSEAQIKRWREQKRAFEAASAFQLALEGTFGEPIKIASGETRIAPADLVAQFDAADLENGDEQGSLFPGISVTDRRRILADRLVARGRDLAAQNHFLHWEIGFPNLWSNLLSSAPQGGFDAVIGNPPYVRQELLGDDAKRALKKAYAVFDGMADLYVYFYEQGLRLLRPGGRMSFVVTNKWLKAGYAEALRDMFTRRAHVEFVADFGHAKHFFPDADVFPSVIVVRKPEAASSGGETTDVCVIPRDAVPRKGLGAAVTAATYPLPRAMFSKESWTLEPPDVMALLAKIKRNGVPLVEYAGVKPYRGILTGLNEAFLIDTPTRDRLVREDPECAEIIKPYLRGQDMERWYAPWKGLWMIFTRRGIDIERYPSIGRHLDAFRSQLEAKPPEWNQSNANEEWGGRKEGTYAWYEIQDSVDYWEKFENPKIIYQEIQYYSSYAIDHDNLYTNNKVFLIPSGEPALLSALNAPIMWWYNWRYLPHMKDEALSPMGFKMEKLPIASLKEDHASVAASTISSMLVQTRIIFTAVDETRDWLRHEFHLERANRALSEPHRLDANEFVASVRAALPKSRKWSAAEIARLKHEHAESVEPARRAAGEVLALERRLSDLVNQAYGLTPEEIALMWRTAPPRMPLDPAEELSRMGQARRN